MVHTVMHKKTQMLVTKAMLEGEAPKVVKI
jgi:hypothetical protein